MFKFSSKKLTAADINELLFGANRGSEARSEQIIETMNNAVAMSISAIIN